VPRGGRSADLGAIVTGEIVVPGGADCTKAVLLTARKLLGPGAGPS